MKREQRLRMKIEEIEDSLREFSEELERVSEANLRKSDNEYNRWVHNRIFDSKDTLVERIESVIYEDGLGSEIMEVIQGDLNIEPFKVKVNLERSN